VWSSGPSLPLQNRITAASAEFVAITRLGADKATVAARSLEDLLGCSAAFRQASHIEPLDIQALFVKPQRRRSVLDWTSSIGATNTTAEVS